MRQLRGVGDHVVVPHRGRRHDLAESHLLCQFLDGIQRRLVCAVHRCYDQIGILKQVGDAGIIAVFLPACHGVRSHIAHAGFLAAYVRSRTMRPFKPQVSTRIVPAGILGSAPVPSARRCGDAGRE